MRQEDSRQPSPPHRVRTRNGTEADDVVVREIRPGVYAADQGGIRVSAEFGSIEQAVKLAESFAEDWDLEFEDNGGA